ncbi:sterol desaturase/sphingolipid hydroxylase (fatty acid hydroxylase superfamily) [Streptomyces sp. SAI-208]|uniref:DUF4383 domain-containing protein n=1 Tax=unclassified Streptomyces TaxID=2593676 RepID=UPI002475D1E1|nr:MULTISPECIES: DUF4383 domain-containing protein [unclassified Streptomyces]MDH6565379.1 sterol desaturase/sphingolipid hydroxylase (fatty acid hydroxylase superfamily) [Streptomyces sp. SAI-117]MDH6589702.1 sterol desaturase/sphingolipid hydroxylase (fatty acid hydroxylase superfamily) [Streptomyces sp. SAI-133]MDH6604944.1 sterol desaturase/sphingolipid hydroxylase (fatty acid hydroxylase superfamily) [Streptomyces sp. SAI-208]
MKLSDELPVDHRLATVYRYGAAFCGLTLLVFGALGFADELSPFSTDGEEIAGMSTNGVLSLVSLVVGLALVGGAVVGGNFASTLNMVVGTLFLLSGFAHIFILDRPSNLLGFGMTNVMFSFVMGLIILTFGMYGRVSSRLPHDNPYWRRRHAREAARESLAARRRERGEALPLPAGGPVGRQALAASDEPREG